MQDDLEVEGWDVKIEDVKIDGRPQGSILFK